MKTRISKELQELAAMTVRRMLEQESRKEELSGIYGNMSVLIEPEGPKASLVTFEFHELGLSEEEIPKAFQGNKVFLMAENLL